MLNNNITLTKTSVFDSRCYYQLPLKRWSDLVLSPLTSMGSNLTDIAHHLAASSQKMIIISFQKYEIKHIHVQIFLS